MAKKRYEEFFSSKEEALEALSPQTVEWYEGDRGGVHYGRGCFYCGVEPTVGYRVEQLSSGQLIGKLVCGSHHTVLG